MPSFSLPLRDASDALRDGDQAGAWQKISPALNFPTGIEMNDAEFAQALGIMDLIGTGSISAATSAALRACRAQPSDAQALYNVGYQMIETGLPMVAATALARANVRHPDVPAIVNELAVALEFSGLHNHAFEALRDAYQARQVDWSSRYLYAFNALMSGHVRDARVAFDQLGPAADDNTQSMVDRLTRFFARLDGVAAASAFNHQDLRGWHYVVTAGVLGHLSPHGFDEGMNGRYAMVQDSDSLIHECVVRAISVLRAWSVRPDRVMYSPDRSSEILAHVWNQRIGIPVFPFGPGEESRPGLFLAYDLDHADAGFVQAMRTRRPAQVLLTHATCWTHDAPYTGDIGGFLYQHNTAPWDGGQMRINPDTQAVERSEPDTSPASAIAARIAAADVTAEALDDLSQLTAFAKLAGPPSSSGVRERFIVGSPVTSSRFN